MFTDPPYSDDSKGVPVVDIATKAISLIHPKAAQRMIKKDRAILVVTKDRAFLVRTAEAAALVSRAEAGDAVAKAALESFQLMYCSALSVEEIAKLYARLHRAKKFTT